MSAEFLANFMRAARSITKAQRSLALDIDVNVQDRVDIEDSLLNTKEFKEMLNSIVTTALTDDTAVISNNLIKDPHDAPNTNVHLHDLRMVVAIPLGSLGAVYLDQHIRNGVFERNVIDQLAEFGRYVIENEQMDLSAEAYVNLFNEMQENKD